MKFYIPLIAATLLFGSCQKKSAKCPDKLHLTASTLTPTVGQSVVLRSNNGQGSYHWTGPNNFFAETVNGTDSLTISSLMINGSGWYYCGASSPGCPTIVDSILIQVQYHQGTPGCTLTNNVITGTAVPDLQATSVIKRLDPTFNGMSLRATGNFGNTSYLVLFNSYKGASEPKDGIYTTKDIQAFNVLEDADRLFIQCQFSNIYFKTKPGQQVYVSHINGKLSVSFCSLQFSGDPGNGNFFTSTFTGKMTEL